MLNQNSIQVNLNQLKLLEDYLVTFFNVESFRDHFILTTYSKLAFQSEF